MAGTLVDSNVLLDVLTDDAEWSDWSSAMLEDAAHRGALYINPVVYAEVSIHFSSVEDLDDALSRDYYRRADLPWNAAFLAGRAFLKYRRGGGVRRSPLPDFFIGAHAFVLGCGILTRDPTRYRGYFPKVPVVTP